MKSDECEVMCQDERKMTALHMAAEQKNGDVLKLLLKKDVNCNIGNSTGKIPLHLAAEKGYER